ncbi:MAG: GIY-YIG nuclease family protein [Rhodospirillales bacterium]|nr:GIY-YIG nuclease family protein [Rhodospirillales bacterium]
MSYQIDISARNDFQVVEDAGRISAVIDSTASQFYVYLLLRPNREPFYVGKGTNKRLFQHEAEARNTTRRTHKLNVIRSIQQSGQRIGYGIACFFDSEVDAHQCERRLIQVIGRHDLGTGPLTNQTDGGEGTSNPSDESRARRAATLGGAAEDPERRAANEFFHRIARQQDSVPIKPLGSRRLERTTPHSSPRQPTQRMAVTLVAAALVGDVPMAAGIAVPRVFAIDGRQYAIENGVAKDMLKAGMIEITASALPEDERFVITDRGFKAVIALIGRDRLLDLGVLDPA